MAVPGMALYQTDIESTLRQRLRTPPLTSRDISMIQQLSFIVKGRESPTLPHGFVTGPKHVICSRGRDAMEHPGNKRFRVLIDIHLAAYKSAPTKIEKTVVVSTIFESIQEASPHGGFVRKIGGKWQRAKPSFAREKIGQRYVSCCGLRACRGED